MLKMRIILLVLAALLLGFVVGRQTDKAVAITDESSSSKDSKRRTYSETSGAVSNLYYQFPLLLAENPTLLDSFINSRLAEKNEKSIPPLLKPLNASPLSAEEKAQLEQLEIQLMAKCDWNGYYLQNHEEQKSAWEKRKTLWHRYIITEGIVKNFSFRPLDKSERTPENPWTSL